MGSTARRYAPMNQTHIPSFPICIPCIDWQTNLPKFIDGNEDEAIMHPIKFHWHIHKLGISFHEDCLTNMFMSTLEGKERSRYEGLKVAYILLKISIECSPIIMRSLFYKVVVISVKFYYISQKY